MDISDSPNGPRPATSGGDVPAAASRAADDRTRLRASQAAITSRVIEYQLDRRGRDAISVQDIPPLSPREQEVIGLVAAGLSDGEIADRLFISKKTASVHVANIKSKLEASSRVEIALIAAQLGFDENDVGMPPSDGREQRRRPVICPFKGLASFGVADSGFFFGREAEVAELVAKLAGSTFLGVVGPSGSGKSSVIRAGLVPAIADGVLPGSDGWAIAIVRPGRTPSTDTRMALNSAIGRIGGGSPEGLSVESLLAGVPEASRVMLVVDQFEELFTICEDVAERTEFVRDLVGLARDPATRALVVLAIRADFYGRCAAYRELTELLGENHVLLGPMTAEGLARAIELPARAAGLRVEPELTSALVTDLLDAPGGLPLLSTTLLELWQRRDGRALTLQTYEAIGGVSGAVSRLAEATFVRLTPRQQAIARAIFLRLAAPDVQDVITSRPVPLSDFDVDRNRDLLGVLAVLINDRLLSVSEGSVEVAHEVLMREWPRLRQWLEADADGRRVREHLSRAADEWKEAAGDPAELYRGARLAAAEEWAAEHALDLNATERAFLDQSRVDAKREGDRQRRSNRRLRALLAGAATLLVVAVVAGGFAAVQLGRAGEQARIAHARELYASAIAVVDEDPELSILLTLQAAALETPNGEAVTNLHRAVQTSRSLIQVEPIGTGTRPSNLGVALSPDGTTLFASVDSGSIQVWDVDSRRLLRTLGTPRADQRADELNVALSPDGRRLAVIDEAGMIHVWDALDWSEQQIQAAGSATDRPVFSPDGLRLATLTTVGDTPDPGAALLLTVWNLETGLAIRSWAWDVPATVAFHPHGEQLLVTDCVCSPERTLALLDISTGVRTTPVGQIEGIFDSQPTAAQISPDGTSIVTVGGDGRVSIWDSTDGALIRSFGDLRDTVNNAAFNNDGTRLATTSQDGTVRIWDPANGDLVQTLVGQGGSTRSAWFSMDGRRIATGSSNLTARVWDLSPGRVGEVGAYELGPGFAHIVDIDALGQLIAVLGRPCVSFCLGQAAVIDLATRQRMDLPDQAGAAIALSPDGTGVVSQAGFLTSNGRTATGPIRMYRLWSGDVGYELEGICPYWVLGVTTCGRAPHVPWDDQAGTLAFSSDSKMLTMAGNWSAVANWDAASGGLLNVRGNVDLAGIASSPDGTLIAAAQRDDRVVLLDAGSLSEVDGFELAQAGRLEFTADGSLLAVSSPEIATQLYAAASWQLQRSLPVHSHDLDFDSKGRLVTADTDGFIRLWDVISGSELQAIPVDRKGIGSQVGRVSFLDDEHHLLTIDNGVLLIMTIDTDELLKLARSRVTRTLSEAECTKYLHEACPP